MRRRRMRFARGLQRAALAVLAAMGGKSELLYICESIYLSIYLSIQIYLSIYLSVYLCLFIIYMYKCGGAGCASLRRGSGRRGHRLGCSGG